MISKLIQNIMLMLMLSSLVCHMVLLFHLPVLSDILAEYLPSKLSKLGSGEWFIQRIALELFFCGAIVFCFAKWGGYFLKQSAKFQKSGVRLTLLLTILVAVIQISLTSMSKTIIYWGILQYNQEADGAYNLKAIAVNAGQASGLILGSSQANAAIDEDLINATNPQKHLIELHFPGNTPTDVFNQYLSLRGKGVETIYYFCTERDFYISSYGSGYTQNYSRWISFFNREQRRMFFVHKESYLRTFIPSIYLGEKHRNRLFDDNFREYNKSRGSNSTLLEKAENLYHSKYRVSHFRNQCVAMQMLSEMVSKDGIKLVIIHGHCNPILEKLYTKGEKQSVTNYLEKLSDLENVTVLSTDRDSLTTEDFKDLTHYNKKKQKEVTEKLIKLLL